MFFCLFICCVDLLSGGPPTRSTPIDSEIHVNKEIATFPENETVYHQEGRPLNIAAPTDPESVPAPAQKKGKKWTFVLHYWDEILNDEFS